jgi:hypothetical protein
VIKACRLVVVASVLALGRAAFAGPFCCGGFELKIGPTDAEVALWAVCFFGIPLGGWLFLRWLQRPFAPRVPEFDPMEESGHPYRSR